MIRNGCPILGAGDYFRSHALTRTLLSGTVEVSLESPAQQPNRARSAQTHSILIVDDNQLITQALRAVLANAGFDVTTFNTGLAALRHAAEQPPDAAIIDIHLPDIS